MEFVSTCLKVAYPKLDEYFRSLLKVIVCSY